MYLVDVSFLKQNPIVIDCRFDMANPTYGPEAYKKSHYPNAYYLHLENDLTAELQTHGGRHPLPDLSVFVEKVGRFGIKNDSQVLLYDDGDLPMASRLWLMLKLIGLKEVYILNGGFKALVNHNIPLTDELPAYKENKFEVQLDLSYICSMEETKQALNDPKAIVVDSRAPERYAGLIEPFDKIAGHIPGTVNYFWKDLFKEDQVKNYGDLEAHFLEMNNYEKVIVHCGSGITGAVNQFFMRELNIPAVLYLGSYSDWISYDENEVIIKDNQKIKAHQ